MLLGRRWLAIAAAVLVVVALATVDLEEAPVWIRDAGLLGAIVLGIAYVVAAVFGLPVAAMTMTAGFAYGVGGGMLAIVPAALIGAMVGFGLGRSFLRERIERRVRRDRRFEAIDRAIGDDGFRVTLLIRLSPILPFGLLNYVLSATSVRPREYALATLLGSIPATLLYVYLGSVAGRATRGGDTIEQLAPIAGLAMAAIAAYTIARIARRALERAREATV